MIDGQSSESSDTHRGYGPTTEVATMATTILQYRLSSGAEADLESEIEDVAAAHIAAVRAEGCDPRRSPTDESTDWQMSAELERLGLACGIRPETLRAQLDAAVERLLDEAEAEGPVGG